MARGKGEGSVTKDAKTGLWVGRVELPAHEYTPDGVPKRRRKVIRRRNKADLIREMADLRRRLDASGDLPTSSPTVESWFTYWLNEVAVKDRRPTTMGSYRSMVKQHVLPVIGKVRLDQVTPMAVRRVLSTMQRNGASPTYQRNTFAVMSAGFKIAERENRIGRNPCDLMDAPLKGVAELEVLNISEASRLVRMFGDDPERYLWATFILTGARRGEILGLEWDRVGDELDLSWQLQRLIWHHGCTKLKDGYACGFRKGAFCPQRNRELPANYEARHLSGGHYLTRPKSKAGWRVIPLVQPLYGILAQWRAVTPPNRHGLVFARNGEPHDPDLISKAWPQVLEAAGIDKKVRIHDLRHGAADLLYEAGVPEDVIIRILGHSTRAMSRSYQSQTNRARTRDAMLRVSESLGFKEITE